MKHISRVVGALLILGTLLVSGYVKKERLWEASALKDHRYMPLLMHLSLKLQYECGGWRLVYEYKPEEK